MIFYVILVIFSDTKALIDVIRSMKIEFIPLVLGIQFLVFFLRSIRQKEFFRNVGINMSVKRNFTIFLSGMSMLMTPGGTGSAIKLQFIKNEYGHLRRKTIPVVFYERYHDFLAIVVLMIIFSFFYSFIISQILIIISSILLILIFMIMKHTKITGKILTKLGNIKFVKKFLDSTEETTNSFSSLISTKSFALGWIISMGAVILDLVTVYLIFYAMQINLNFIVTSQLFLTSIIAGLFSLLPAGAGVTEGSFLSLLVSNGIKISLASAVVLVIRFVTLWFATIVGFITLKFLKF